MLKQIEEIYDYLQNKKYKDIAVYDLSNEQQSCNIMFIVSVTNQANNKKLALQLMEDLKLLDYPEGFNKGEWIVFDLDEIIIHCFVTSVREKYNLDKLWKSKFIDMKKNKVEAKKKN